MKINFHKYPGVEKPSRMTLEAFADKYNCVLEIYERFSTNLPISTYYIACLNRLQFKDGSIPIDYYVTGLTPEEAVQKFINCISGAKLTFNPKDDMGFENVRVPILTFSGKIDCPVAI